MAYDFQKFSVTRLAAAQLTVPRWAIELEVRDSTTGELVRDFMGANRLLFPNVLGQLTNAQQDEVVEMIVGMLVRRRAGLD